MCHQVVALKVLSSLLMPNFTNFFHDVEGWNIRHVLGDSHSSLSHEKHVGCQRLLGQLIEKSLVTDCAELCQFLRKSFFVSFSSLFVFLLLLLRQFLPLLSYHPHNLCHFDTRIFYRDNFSLLISKQNIRRLWLLDRNVLGCVECSVKLCEISEIDSHLTIPVQNRTETVLLGAWLISCREVVM